MTATMENDPQLGGQPSDVDPPRPFQISSYQGLLQFPDIPTASKDTPSGARDISIPVVDAIIVPTIRSAEQVSYATELASQARCQLLLLYTDKLPSELTSVLARLKGCEATPLALQADRHHYLIDLGAVLPQSLASSAAHDISRKRNLGLLIGRMCGWTRMLLLDDDIRRLSIEKLSVAAAVLDQYPVVGLKVTKYPDASVVGHARRLTGRRQEPFISGGSLLVNPQRLNGFFPAIYHEDWLCIINHLRLSEVAMGGRVGQLRYEPFISPARAKYEEFGDILASGLLWLVHARNQTGSVPATAPATDADYWAEATSLRFWEQILEQRSAMLHEVAKRLTVLGPPDLSPLPSVVAARQRCNELRPEEFVSFTKAWVSSLSVWQERLSNLPQVDSVEKAIIELGVWDIVHPRHADPRPAPGANLRQRHAKVLTMGSASFILGGVVGAALSALKRFRDGTRESSLSPDHGEGGWLCHIQRGGGACGRAQGPPSGGDQAEREDDGAACGQ